MGSNLHGRHTLRLLYAWLQAWAFAVEASSACLPVAAFSAESQDGNSGFSLLQHAAAGHAAQPGRRDDGSAAFAGVHVVMYYIRFAENPKKLKHYAQALERQCSELANVTAPLADVHVTVIGSLGWIANVSPSCAPFLQGGTLLDESSLRYDEEVRGLLPSCSPKFQESGAAPTPEFDRLVRIWLNKLPLLCQAADEHPDALTMLIDANLFVNKPHIWAEALRIVEDPKSVQVGRMGMPHYHPPQLLHKTWFGQESCMTPPYLRAKYLAVRGRDCPRLMKEYASALDEVTSSKTCGCFDEETVFARMFAKIPGLFVT